VRPLLRVVRRWRRNAVCFDIAHTLSITLLRTATHPMRAHRFERSELG
jgi:hypothetical protein